MNAAITYATLVPRKVKCPQCCGTGIEVGPSQGLHDLIIHYGILNYQGSILDDCIDCDGTGYVNGLDEIPGFWLMGLGVAN